ncbi:curli assembly protein CsgF [Loktanella sp. M215]|uniref:curli assembly protein CsgF n=1 Tax=Loktanella sp. M215 TaxID=2675431 RepID=UPI001F92BC65|nr:hypothetical protein [Loktanella sp. M215]
MVSARILLGLGAAALLASAETVIAGDLVYKPIIPAFGGFADNYGYLLGTAQIQNQYLPPSESGGGGGAPDINFPPIVIDLGGVGTPATPPTAAQNTNTAGGAVSN